MIDIKNELFKWGPIDGKPIYIDAFTYSFVNFPNYIDGTWPDLIGYFGDEKIVFIGDDKDLRDEGEKIFNKYLLGDGKLENKYKKWVEYIDILLHHEKEINLGLSDLNDKELLFKYKKFLGDYELFWMSGFLPELGNYGAERLLLNMIHTYDGGNSQEIFEKISAPEDLSFFQVEEKELLEIKLINDKTEKERLLDEHQRKYYWLRNNYHETKVLDKNYFRDELDKISPGEAKGKIEKIDEYRNNIKSIKREIVEKYNIPNDIVKIGDKLAYCVWWQDLRKKYIFIANHILKKFLDETSRRKNVGISDLEYYRDWEIAELLEKGVKTDVSKRKIGYVMYYHRLGNVTEIEGEDANDFVKPFLEIKIDNDLREFSGIVVSKGENNTMQGKVRILYSVKDLNKMKQGDILVAPMTSPDFIVAMRKASAIVTDEGGMTSHAAIVSRELGIPCIVGTKIATKVLKDGDMIEVDVNSGIIRVINN